MANPDRYQSLHFTSGWDKTSSRGIRNADRQIKKTSETRCASPLPTSTPASKISREQHPVYQRFLARAQRTEASVVTRVEAVEGLIDHLKKGGSTKRNAKGDKRRIEVLRRELDRIQTQQHKYEK